MKKKSRKKVAQHAAFPAFKVFHLVIWNLHSLFAYFYYKNKFTGITLFSRIIDNFLSHWMLPAQ